jgi:predicted unusual protein kinase regulating ubiquinone biosynthesis (AarF/ABC1/UbiB family)
LVKVPHPAVATLYSISDVLDPEDRVVPAILMERLVGEELDRRLQREVSLREVIDWGREILEVFDAMHSVDHFHPDPHSGNFFVTDRGLRLYDVLYSLTAEQRSTNTRESFRELDPLP